MSAYTELEARFRRLSALGGALAMLEWDQAVMMPTGGAEARADQMATLGLMRHEELTAAETGDLLAAAEAELATLGSWQQANLREMRRLWRQAGALPGALVEAQARAAAKAEMAWREARAKDDFSLLSPHLAALLDLTREVAGAKAEVLSLDPYDALLDEFEPGARAAEIEALFADLVGFLPDFLDQVLERQDAPVPLPGPFPIGAQRALAERLMRAIGFDFAHGRLDISLHPFTGGVPEDVRITTRYDEADFTRALMGVLHETGHALYERGLPEAWRHQPVGAPRGMALHESQSLLIEMQVCRSPAFLHFAAPLLREAFSGRGPAWSESNLYAHYRRVARGLIRVDADEVSYPLHIILRYRLERALISGDLEVVDLPAAWNEGMRALLGVTPQSDQDGCLQDIHWPGGAFGYFPTYTLGALAAAQFYAAARAADGAIEPAIAAGDFRPLLAWLRTRVHGQGSFLSTAEIVAGASGAPLGTAAFKAHLRARYGG